MLICPKCHEELKRDGNRYVCVNGHSYDIAKEGYVNLVLANQKHSADPGDSADSLRNRRAFLSQGYYQPLAEKLASLVQAYMKDGQQFLDAGCGTGYYLNYVMNTGKDMTYYACDLAKKGVAMSAKANKQAICFVGNIFHTPFSDESLDGLMSVFCPYSGEEFGRIIKDGGYVISVTPGRKHLFQLKEIVYREPYENEENGYNLPGFREVERSNITYSVTLKSNADIRTLWEMTPYYHTTSPSDNEKLLTRDSADTVIDFLVCVYRKESTCKN